MKLTVDQLKELVEGAKVDSKGKNIVGKCPYCGFAEFGMSILLENHPWQCYRKSKCGESGTIYKLLKLRGKLNDFRKEFGSGKEGNRQELTKEITTNIRKRDKVVEIEDLPEETLPLGFKRLYEHPYLEGRGFTDFEYQKYIIGVSKIDPRYGPDYVILGIHQNNKLVGYLGRHIKSKNELDEINQRRKLNDLKPILRYNNSRSSDFSKMLLGYDEITENTHTIILVEGYFDKVRVDQLLELDKSEDTKCLCSFTSNLSDDQKLLLHTVTSMEMLVVLYDGDVISKIKHVLKDIQYDYPNVMVGFHPTKDPGDMDINDILEVFDKLETPDKFLVSKLNMKPLRRDVKTVYEADRVLQKRTLSRD